MCDLVHDSTLRAGTERRAQRALFAIRKLLGFLEAAPVDGAVIHDAALLGGPDFEDDVVAVAAARWGAEAIITRDPDGFRVAACKVWSPEELLAVIARTPGAAEGSDADELDFS